MDYLNASFINQIIASMSTQGLLSTGIASLESLLFADISWLTIFHVWFVLFVLLSVVVILSHVYYKTCANTDVDANCCIRGKRVLLVIAHPDDECMFFGPTIVNLVKKKVYLYVLCLSEGNYYGDGESRSRELWKSCAELGIPSGNVRLFKSGFTPDDPLVDWDPRFVAKLLYSHVVTMDMDVLLTFDDYGVSGHRNHIAISRAVQVLLSEKKLPASCQVFALKSENLFVKYIGFLIVLLNRGRPNVFVSSCDDHRTIKNAMSKHASQYVWFRKLFVTFSSYCYLNTLICLKS